MPKRRDVVLYIDKELGVESKIICSRIQKNVAIKSESGIKYKGVGLGLKPAYEPIFS